MTGPSGAQPPQITLLAARPGRPRISGGRAPGVAFAPLTSLLILALATVSWPNDSLAQTTAPAPKPAGENTLPPLPRVAPVAPAQAAATIRAQHGFHLDLLAAEPLVMDPVAIEYDEDGRAWVVEMSDYPYTDKSTDKPFVERTTDLPLGRVRILEDVDGDGRFDRSDVFADQLSWPTGLAFWRGGVYVAATPDIWYLRDTDGDRRADQCRGATRPAAPGVPAGGGSAGHRGGGQHAAGTRAPRQGGSRHVARGGGEVRHEAVMPVDD